MTAPSRTFMVTQSVLNAIEYWRPFYSRQWLASWNFERPLPSKSRDQITAEYRKIAAQYEGPAQ